MNFARKTLSCAFAIHYGRSWNVVFRTAQVMILSLILAACQVPVSTTPIAPTPPGSVPAKPTWAQPTASPPQAQAAALISPTFAPLPSSPTPVPTRQPNIVVSAPTRDQAIQSPVQIAGRARVFEGTVEFELVAEGRSLGRGFTTATAGGPEWGAFDAHLNFDAPSRATAGVLRVFSTSAKDGSIQDLVEIPVRVQPRVAGAPTATGMPAMPTAAPAAAKPTPATRRLVVFFPRLLENDVVFVPVNRDVPATPAVGRAALEELLKGPTAQERAKGLSMPIPEGTRLLSLRIVEGTAYADFDERLEYRVGGSLWVMTIRRSIELTLKQFSTVQRVVISVEGRTEDILQP